MIRGISNANNKTTDFEAVIEEIDKDLLDMQPSSNPTVAKIVREIKGRSSKENKHGNPAYMGEDFEEHLNAQITQVLGSQNKDAELMGFTIRWKATDKIGKGAKSGKGRPSKVLGKKGKKVIGPVAQKEIKKGQWSRLTNRPKIDVIMEEVQNMEDGPKRKTSEKMDQGEVNIDREKKLKVEKETKRLSALFATHLGLAEVAKQPHWEQ